LSEGKIVISPPLPYRTTSWVLYDLANTIFSATVTFLFAANVPAASTGVINSLAMIVAGFATPIFASVADRTGRAGEYNALTTLIGIAAMGCFGIFSSTTTLLIAFFVATLFYQAALVFYNSLLPSVARDEHLGLVSGLGVGLGYIGTVFTLVIALPLKSKLGLDAAYFVTTAAFLLFALPCLLLVRDRRPISREKISFPLVRSQWRELFQTVKTLPQQPALLWFLIANFWAVDVLNTAILFFGRFLKDAFLPMAERGELVLMGKSIASIDTFLIIGGIAVNVPALFFGLGMGYLADRFGSRKMFFISIAALSLGLTGAGIFGGWEPMGFLLSICLCGGIGLAGIWTVGRKLLIQLVPRELVARYFGLYGITNKVSVIGSTVFGLMLTYWGPRWAILSQVLPLIFAFFCVAMMARAKTHRRQDQ
jgi:UMF1 family MFS transporter